ncbi:hypothetical protein KCU71_g5773, partial [Aureobasidium melanogenum]
MEALSFIALTVTVATLAKNLTELLRDGKHVAKYLQETRDDLKDLKGVILQVHELLSRPDLKSNFTDSSAVRIIEATHKDFESCQRFILEFLSSNETTSFSSRFKRLAVPNRRKDNYAALNRKITDHIIRAQISLQMLDLHVTSSQRERKALLEKLSKTIAKLEQTKIDMQTLHQREMNDLRRANEKQAAQHSQQMSNLQNRIHETERASVAQANASRKALEDQKKDLNRQFDEEIHRKDLQMNQLRQEMREVSISSKRSEESAARMAENLNRLALQEKNISRERDQLLHVINNNNTNNDNSTYNTRNTRFSHSANRSNRSNYSPSMSYDDYGGWDIDDPIRETSGTRGPTGGPPPPKPTMVRMNPKSKNLHQAFAIREENQRRQRAYERQLNAYYGAHDLYHIFDQLRVICTYGHSQLKTGHPVRSAIHKQLNGRLVLRWVTTWESLLL